jgi:NTE family protein
MFRNQKYNRSNPFTLVLGGGGARGLAHIGVFKALERVGLVPSLIVGTSMGSLIGGMYSQLGNLRMVEKNIRTFLEGDFFKRIGLEQFSNSDNNLSISVWERFATHLRRRYFFSKSVLGTGMFAQTTLLHSLHMLLEDKRIEDLSIRFAAVACDLATGEEVICTSGSIINAVAASSAVPGVVAPFAIGSRFLVDGTVTSTIPVPAARTLSKDPIIAVDVRRSIKEFERHRHGYEVVIHASEITSYKLNDIHLQKADVIIRPDVRDVEWNQFHCMDQCITAGERAVENIIAEITKLLKKHRFRFFPWL